MNKCTFSQKRDRISYVSEPIRSHIVSFLPMKDAIRTSVLSRQWNSVSTSLSISNLEFDWRRFEKENLKLAQFRDFVDALLFRHGRSDIQRFSLKAKIDDVLMTFHHVCAYLSFAVVHNVQEIELVISDCSNVKNRGMLPRRLFTCKALTMMSLVSVKTEWPSVVSFPALKSLTLEDILFGDNCTLNKLISSSACPVLENLSIVFCILPHQTTLSISNPSLKYLKLHDRNDIPIKMSITSLQELECVCLRPLNFSFENLPTLVSATLQFLEKFGHPDKALDLEFNCATKLVKSVGCVKKLILNSGITEILSRGEDLPSCLPAPCCSVKYLHVGMFPVKLHVQVITLLLRTYPSVQNLQIYVEKSEEASWFSKCMNMERNWRLEELMSQLMSHENTLNCLETVKILNFQGNEHEVELVKYLIRNSKFLKNLNIKYLYPREVLKHQKTISRIKLMSWLARDFPSISTSVM